MDFVYQSFPNKVFFGPGKIGLLPELLSRNGRIMVLASNRLGGQVTALKESLGQERILHFDKIVQHVPETLVEEASAQLSIAKPELLLAIGGGSAIGLAKALALQHPLRIIAVPTTYSGSEQTNIYGISSAEGKRTGRDDRVLPAITIYDPELTVSMPKALAVTSAMNAMAHLMEAIYAPNRNPVTQNNAILGIQATKKGMEVLATSETLSREANEQLLFGAYLAGKCLGEVSMSLHHKAAHVLGGSFGMEHSKVHTVLQAYVLAYQWPYLPSEMQSIFREVLGSEHPPLKLKTLAGEAGGPTDLKSIGFRVGQIEQAAALIQAKPYANVAPITIAGLEQMLHNAYKGVIRINQTPVLQ